VVAHGKGKVVEGGKVKGLIMVTVFTNSQKLAWMNNLIIACESEFDPESKKSKVTGMNGNRLDGMSSIHTHIHNCCFEIDTSS
jgi:hypothetical protein